MNYAIQINSSPVTQAFGPLKAGQLHRDQRAPATLAPTESTNSKSSNNTSSQISFQNDSEQKKPLARQESTESFRDRIDQILETVADAKRSAATDLIAGRTDEVSETDRPGLLEIPAASLREDQDHYGFLDDRLFTQTGKLAHQTYDQIGSAFFRERDLASLIVGVDTFV